ncbi:MAG: hypothetical protein J0I70_03420 [Microbacterium sp.]|uniref:permease prefix domain 1-containing protein n=1 Tax=Microbacterium sp. TaxID=51671 RepID=UPI001AC69ECE|nr:permease prefix domain 1-containing protein [Microbacterium sp.]MBN9173188.1 hypothetical protein [Microbacterium sp.]
MDPQVESQITAWREFAARRAAIGAVDVAELEGHLRDQIDVLVETGLDPDEAFLVAIRRLGRLDDLSREYAREHSDRLWKQLVLADTTAVRGPSRLIWALGFAVCAAAAIKIPALLGVGMDAAGSGFYVRNAALLPLSFLALFFLVRRGTRPVTATVTLAAFAVAAVVMNSYPFAAEGATQLLAGLHVFVVLWLVVGLAYVGDRWRSGPARMDFIRFTGEWLVYLALIGLGGGVLAGITIGVFAAIGLDPGVFVAQWLLPCGAAGAVVVAAWLVEAKQSVIENIAPVLTKVFTPLFTALLLALIVAGLIQRSLVPTDRGPAVFGERDLLIIFDVVLLVVLGLLLYSLSARVPDAPAGWFDRLQLVMVVAALVVDLLVLVAMIGRIGAYGASPNKLASLGLNLILLANLAGAAWLQLRFVRHRGRFATLENWQTAYVPVYLAWAAAVVIVFPPAFSWI